MAAPRYSRSAIERLHFESRIKLQKAQIDSLRAEINIALTFAHTARLLRARGSTHGDRCLDKAWEVYAEACRELKTPRLDRELRESLTNKLNWVRLILDTLGEKQSSAR
jgi:hypothetical protein